MAMLIPASGFQQIGTPVIPWMSDSGQQENVYFWNSCWIIPDQSQTDPAGELFYGTGYHMSFSASGGAGSCNYYVGRENTDGHYVLDGDFVCLSTFSKPIWIGITTRSKYEAGTSSISRYPIGAYLWQQGATGGGLYEVQVRPFIVVQNEDGAGAFTGSSSGGMGWGDPLNSNPFNSQCAGFVFVSGSPYGDGGLPTTSIYGDGFGAEFAQRILRGDYAAIQEFGYQGNYLDNQGPLYKIRNGGAMVTTDHYTSLTINSMLYNTAPHSADGTVGTGDYSRRPFSVVDAVMTHYAQPFRPSHPRFTAALRR